MCTLVRYKIAGVCFIDNMNIPCNKMTRCPYEFKESGKFDTRMLILQLISLSSICIVNEGVTSK